jgi:hypothetical protein
MSQELNIIERDPNYVNPYKRANSKIVVNINVILKANECEFILIYN